MSLKKLGQIMANYILKLKIMEKKKHLPILEAAKEAQSSGSDFDVKRPPKREKGILYTQEQAQAVLSDYNDFINKFNYKDRAYLDFLAYQFKKEKKKSDVDSVIEEMKNALFSNLNLKTVIIK
jgi:hypothetical protein